MPDPQPVTSWCLTHSHRVELAQDPLLSRLKMIAEPWDIGPGGYQGGAFPAATLNPA